MTLKHFYSDPKEVGVDEAGRGPLLGRVYAGAVIWDSNKYLEYPEIDNVINDSKKLSSKKRKLALKWIKENLIWSVGYADENEIDKYNILNATKLAMDRALNNLTVEFNKVIIDGTGWEKKFNLDNFNVTSIIKGDANYYSIACASIIAKEYHDEHIINLYKECPELNEKYCILKNMGYPTKEHKEGIVKYGITKYHRKTYKPCNEI